MNQITDNEYERLKSEFWGFHENKYEKGKMMNLISKFNVDK